ARDRILDRLLHDGLSAERDLPVFLRVAGGQAGDRLRLVRDLLLRFRMQARAWVNEGMMTAPCTAALADLMFAYGLARVGDASECRTLMGEAESVLHGRDVVAKWLGAAYRFRDEQAFKGGPAAGLLPKELLDALEG